MNDAINNDIRSTQESSSAISGYAPPSFAAPIELDLSRNEGCFPLPMDRVGSLLTDASGIERYPDQFALQTALANTLGVPADQCVVTTGGDDGIDRVFRLVAQHTRGRAIRVASHAPTFEMITISATRVNAAINSVEWWTGPFPVDEMLSLINQGVDLVVLVSPNNPTGGMISGDALQIIIEAARDAKTTVLLDHAYIEFADSQSMPDVGTLDHVIVVRTLSKAWGMAGLRIGCLVAAPAQAAALRAMGGPFPVSGPGGAVAIASLSSAGERTRRFVAHVRAERNRLSALIRKCGGEPLASEANFVLARWPDAGWIARGLASLGVGVRQFRQPELSNMLRITCPQNQSASTRLHQALETLVAPKALLFDLDGVIADVSRSYRQSIIATAQSFGITVTEQDVARFKRLGDANNDWILTNRLIESATGQSLNQQLVTDRFEQIYQGSNGIAGLKERESILLDPAILERLHARYALGLVTGRPRRDAEAFLNRHAIRQCFDSIVCMEDSDLKPNPAPVRLALTQMNVQSAWMIGDTVDDIVAARRAGVVPIGVVAPGDDQEATRAALQGAGAACVLDSTDQIEELIP